ncbi:MAG: NAD(+)/NADH kinase [Myxococcota bacterium]
MRLGVVLKKNAKEALTALRRIHMVAQATPILVEDNGAVMAADMPEGVRIVPGGEFAKVSDLVIVLGGDGTLIHAASLLRDRVVPIIGVNLGHVGFLTDIAMDEIERAVPLALESRLPHLDRLRLDVRVTTMMGDMVVEKRVLNDATLTPGRMARLAEYRIMLGGELVTSMRGDGLIVSTPTGSTAYSMAAGGSIVWPGLHAVAVTPICPHSLTQRPLVLDPSGELEVRLVGQGDAVATFDGQASCPFGTGDVMTINVAPVPTRLLSLPGGSYFQTLRAKLRWGSQ